MSTLASTDILSAVNLRMNPKGFNGVYGCMMELESDNEANHLRYKQRFEYIGGQNQNKHVFRITRFDEVYINDRLPDTPLNELAHEASKALYPLEVECRLTGSFIKASNFKEVKRRWGKKKKRLLERYSSKGALTYLELMDRTFAFEERFQEKLRSDYFLALYFKPIFQYYTAFFNFETTFKYPLLGGTAPVNFKVRQSIDDKAIFRDDYRVYISGDIEDKRSLADLEQKFEIANYPTEDDEKEDKGSCDIMYMLNNRNKMIEGVDATFKLNFGPTRRLKVKMFLLD